MNQRRARQSRDALDASTSIRFWTQDATFERYLADGMLRSAIERQFGIVGEALNVVRSVDLATADQVPDLHGWISMRTFVIHIYDRIAWDNVKRDIPALS